jgi:hypothetical protein
VISRLSKMINLRSACGVLEAEDGDPCHAFAGTARFASNVQTGLVFFRLDSEDDGQCRPLLGLRTRADSGGEIRATGERLAMPEVFFKAGYYRHKSIREGGTCAMVRSSENVGRTGDLG